MSADFKRLIEALIEEEFAAAPQMGDIDPTPEDDADRPLMDKRPKGGGMDVSQHHKMMWAEDVANRSYHEEDSEQERLVDIILMRRSMGQEVDNIVDGLKDRFDVEDIYLAYEAAKMLESHMPDDDSEVLEEMSAISGGAAGLASAGKVSATSGGSAWKSNSPEHELMWSGDLPHSERPDSPDAKKKV